MKPTSRQNDGALPWPEVRESTMDVEGIDPVAVYAALMSTLVRTVFAQPDAASAWAQHARVVDQPAERFPAAAELLADAAANLLAFTAFPAETGARPGPTIPRSG
jgi:hypothetical protein